jgi:hypothetical protein
MAEKRRRETNFLTKAVVIVDITKELVSEQKESKFTTFCEMKVEKTKEKTTKLSQQIPSASQIIPRTVTCAMVLKMM